MRALLRLLGILALLSSPAFAGPPAPSPGAPGVPFFIANGVPYQEGVFLGPRAGQNAPSNIPYGTVGIGPSALQNLSTGNEHACVGAFACQFVTTGNNDTAFGEHAIGYDNPQRTTAIGADTMRDRIGATGDTAIGADSQKDGVQNNTTSVGFAALRGAAGSITASGTFTPGDNIRVTFNSTNPAVNSGAYAQITVTAGMNGTTFAQAMKTAINAMSPVTTFTLSSGITTQVDNGVWIQAFLAPFGSDTNQNIIGLQFPGGQTAGWAVTPVVTCTGTCGQTITVADGTSGQYNDAFGINALSNPGMTTANHNAGFGTNTLASLTTGSNNVAVGTGAGVDGTTMTGDVLLGLSAGSNVTVGNYNLMAGYQAGLAMVAGGSNVFLGPLAGNTQTAGNNNIAIGNSVVLPTTNAGNQINIGNTITGTLNTGTNNALVNINGVVQQVLQIQYSAPTTGSTLTVTAGYDTIAVMIEPVATIAALTIALPSNPVNGQTVNLSTTQTITAVTYTASSGVSPGTVATGAAPATLPQGTHLPLRFNTAQGKWY